MTQCVAEVRRALGPEAQKILRTVPRRGYLLPPPATVCNGAGDTTPRFTGQTTSWTVTANAAQRYYWCSNLSLTNGQSLTLQPGTYVGRGAACARAVAGRAARGAGHGRARGDELR